MKRKSTLLLLYCIKYYDAAIADAILMYGFHQMNGLHYILNRAQKPLVKTSKGGEYSNCRSRLSQ